MECKYTVREYECMPSGVSMYVRKWNASSRAFCPRRADDGSCGSTEQRGSEWVFFLPLGAVLAAPVAQGRAGSFEGAKFIILGRYAYELP